MKILIADDESIIRMGLKSMLHELGHTVFAAKNGRDALRQAREYSPDLVILDIRMPYPSGLDVAKILYNERPLPIIMLTAYSNEVLIEKATSLPIQAYLIKPIKVAELSASISISAKRFQDQQDEISLRIRAEKRLEDRKLLDRAKGQLMKLHGWDEDQAYTHIQERSRESRQSLREISEEVVFIEPAQQLLVTRYGWTLTKARNRIKRLSKELGIDELRVATKILKEWKE